MECVPQYVCTCCVCQGISCMLPHMGHSCKNGIEVYTSGELILPDKLEPSAEDWVGRAANLEWGSHAKSGSD